MPEDFKAILSEHSPRYSDWITVFGSNEVALKQPLPQPASAPGIKAALFYELDLTALTKEQRARMIAHIARRFHLPEEEVAATLDSEGCPILAEDVTNTRRSNVSHSTSTGARSALSRIVTPNLWKRRAAWTPIGSV